MKCPSIAVHLVGNNLNINIPEWRLEKTNSFSFTDNIWQAAQLRRLSEAVAVVGKCEGLFRIIFFGTLNSILG